MKILINATNIGRQLSGLSVYTLSLLKELVKLDKENEYLIVVNKTSLENISEIDFPVNFRLKLTGRYISSDYGTRGHFLRFLYANYLALIYRRYLIFTSSQLEAVVVPARQIIVIQDVIHLMDKSFNKKQYIYFKYVLKIAAKRALKIIVPSQFTKTQILKYYNTADDKVIVTHLGIQQLFKEQIGKDGAKKEKYILYVGRIAETKNTGNLLEAFRSIKDKIDYKLVVAGNGNKRFIDELKYKGLINNRVELRSDLKIQNLLELYKKAALFVFPSLYEGFGLPPLEAMACGCPVVVSDTTSLPEVCGDAAVYVDPTDIKSIADGILKVLGDDKLREEMVKKGYLWAKGFTWEKTARETLAVINSTKNNY